MKTAKKFLSVTLCLCLLVSLFSGCETEQDRLYSQAMSKMAEYREESDTAPEEGEENAEQITLTINVWDVIADSYKNYAEAFTKENPNITIEIIGFPYDNESDLEKLAVELLAGEGGDIVQSSFLSTSKLAGSGVFVPLDEYFEAIPDFSWDDYYTNVLDAIRYKGKLYHIPEGFTFQNVRLRTEVAEALDFEVKEEISLSEILDLKIASQEIDTLPSPMYLPRHDFLLEWEFAARIDESTGTASLHTPEFIDLLERMKQVDRGRAHGLYPHDAVELGKEDFCSLPAIHYTIEGDAQKYLDNIGSEVLTPAMQLTAGDGNKVFGAMMFSMTSACTEREAAAKFMRFIMDNELMRDPDDENYDNGGIAPVNRETNSIVMERVFGSENAEVIEQFDYWCSEVDTLSMTYRNGPLHSTLLEIANQYFNDLITAEECARQMQERAWIYLNE